MKLSVTIITLNEEKNIERAIRSVSFADEIIIIDSNSTDTTVQKAKNLGVKVINRPFLGYGQQKNLAASFCQGDWILSIDADEEVSEELANSIKKIINKNYLETEMPIYLVSRRTQFCKKWIYHGGWYPDKLARLYRPTAASWTTPKVHEILEPTQDFGPPECLSGYLNHYSFPTVLSQVETNVKYATLGSMSLLEKKKPALISIFIRPTIKFIECYFLKKGILDGIPGLIIAINAAYSHFMKYTFAYQDRGND